MMAFIAAIGKLFGDGGLQDILASFGVYAHSSANLMLQRKHLDCGIRGIKLAHEALVHLFLIAAESCARHRKLPWVDAETAGLVNDLNFSFKHCDKQTSSMICEQLDSKVSVAMNTVSKFSVFGREQSVTFAYWDSFPEASGTLLRLMRADREADFLLHLASVMETVPSFHLAGRLNYARYTPVHIMEMQLLEKNTP